MLELLPAIARLTRLTEEDELEAALAAILCERLQPRQLRVWRVIRKQAKVVLHQTFVLADNPGTLEPELPLEACEEPLRSCCQAKTEIAWPLPKHEGSRRLFPVSDGRNLFCVIDLWARVVPDSREYETVRALLEIYRNHLTMLNCAHYDALTGLFNRRTFDDRFKRAMAALGPNITQERRRLYLPSVHLAAIDIDFFKRVNDRFGHAYGDEVLVLVAGIMRQSFRDSDRLFRFGGEEFLVILPETDPQNSRLALERFRMAIEGRDFPQLGRLSVSIGFTALQACDSGSDALGRADRALYMAKRWGRNQVQCYEQLLATGALQPVVRAHEEVEMF